MRERPNTTTAELNFDEVQKLRYEVGGKGGDGDPAFARDMSLKSMMQRTRGEFSSSGIFKYMRKGD
jgi:hypothetical protein